MLVRALCRNQAADGNPENVYQNTFHIDCPSVQSLAANADALMGSNMLPQFYASVGRFMSATLNNQLEVRFYDLGDQEPRVPEIRTASTPYGDPAKANLPEELCVVLTLLPVAPITRRRRGRLYLGPCNTDCIEYAINDAHPMVPLNVTQDIAGAATVLQSGIASSGRRWVVRSEKYGTITDVAGGYVDNAIDIQRRRGTESTLRTFWGDAGTTRQAERSRAATASAPDSISDHLMPPVAEEPASV